MNNHRILIVEDEADVSCALQSFLGRRGFIVSATSSGREALCLVEVSRPDLILLDIALNDINGVEVLQQLRDKQAASKVVVITGQMYPPHEVERIKGLGAIDYLQKPVSLAQLEKVIHAVLGTVPYFPVPMKSAINEVESEMLTEGAFYHRLKNILGVVRNKCENTLLDEQGSGTSSADVADLMKELIRKIDQAVELINQRH